MKIKEEEEDKCWLNPLKNTNNTDEPRNPIENKDQITPNQWDME